MLNAKCGMLNNKERTGEHVEEAKKTHFSVDLTDHLALGPQSYVSAPWREIQHLAFSIIYGNALHSLRISVNSNASQTRRARPSKVNSMRPLRPRRSILMMLPSRSFNGPESSCTLSPAM